MIESIAVSPDARALLIGNSLGAKAAVTAVALRKAARDAVSLRERLDKGDIEVAADITITGVEQVGSTGINVKFSDGHHRAIYPVSYLTELMVTVDK